MIAQRQQDQEGTTAAVHKDEWAALSFGPGKIQALLQPTMTIWLINQNQILSEGGRVLLIIGRTEEGNQTVLGVQNACLSAVLPSLQTDVRRTINYK